MLSDEEYLKKLRKRVVRFIQKETQKKYTSILREIEDWGVERLEKFIEATKLS